MMRGGDERRRSAVFGSDECSLPCSSAAWAEKAHLYWRGRGQLNALAATNAPGLVRRGVSSRPVVGIGGMNHILVPGRCDGNDRESRGGVHAMELLINAIMNQGGDRRRLVAKVFGAANVLPALQSPTAGELNATFVRDFLATERIPLVAQRLGGKHAVQVHFRTDTGKTIVHSVDGSRLPAILSAEAYCCDYEKAGSSGDIDLF
jgi:chemotaxis protein CheD